MSRKFLAVVFLVISSFIFNIHATKKLPTKCAATFNDYLILLIKQNPGLILPSSITLQEIYSGLTGSALSKQLEFEMLIWGNRNGDKGAPPGSSWSSVDQGHGTGSLGVSLEGSGVVENGQWTSWEWKPTDAPSAVYASGGSGGYGNVIPFEGPETEQSGDYLWGSFGGGPSSGKVNWEGSLDGLLGGFGSVASPFKFTEDWFQKGDGQQQAEKLKQYCSDMGLTARCSVTIPSRYKNLVETDPAAQESDDCGNMAPGDICIIIDN